MTIPSSDGFLGASGSCLPMTPEEEKEIVMELMRAADDNIKAGDVYCLVAHEWWIDWQRYTGFDMSTEELAGGVQGNIHRPGAIDNSYLISENDGLELVRNLQEYQDYDLLPQDVWRRFLEWYGGGPELPRKVISGGFNGKTLNIEVYPLCLQIIDARDNSQRSFKISRMASVCDLYDVVCTQFNLEKDKAHIWDYYNKTKHHLLSNLNQTLEDAQLLMDQEILLEVTNGTFWTSVGNDLASVPLEPSRSSFTISGGPALSNGYSSTSSSNSLHNSYNSTSGNTEDGDDIPSNDVKVDGRGLTGLHNLGNTCFMNSAIQCLVHTPPLVDYFLKDYAEEINKENPLGLQGELAIAFGELLRNLWSAGQTSVAPRAFKAKLARFAPQFSGYNQHDSQELLAFLLDGLHEDLNRVKNKPYVEAKDANGRPDEEFAEECWRNHKARNDSIVVDICQGQYKSTLVCPVCSKVSVTFDPFMYLSLPLPSTLTRTITVTIFSGDGSALPMPYTVTVPKNGFVKDLIQALSSISCLKNNEALLLAEVYNHQIYRYLENSFDSLSSIKDEEYIVAYRLPVDHDKVLRLEITHRKAERCSSDPQFSRQYFGTPLVTCLPKDRRTGTDIHGAVCSVLAPLLRTTLVPHHSHDKTFEENGAGPNLDSSSSDDVLMSDMGMKEIADRLPPFLHVLTDRSSLSGTIEADSNNFLGSCMSMFMDWSEKELELYDFSYLDDLPDFFKSGFMSKKTRPESVSLYSCLEAFLKEEPLGPDDMWYCPGCKAHRQASKKLDLWRLPEILVIHLKRFSYSRYMKNKLDTLVNFQIRNVDLSKYVMDKAIGPQNYLYELYAVSNHYGGLGGGHYTAYAKLIEEDSWYHFDDSFVSPVNEAEIKTSAAYVLFYKRASSSKEVLQR